MWRLQSVTICILEESMPITRTTSIYSCADVCGHEADTLDVSPHCASAARFEVQILLDPWYESSEDEDFSGSSGEDAARCTTWTRADLCRHIHAWLAKWSPINASSPYVMQRWCDLILRSDNQLSSGLECLPELS